MQALLILQGWPAGVCVSFLWLPFYIASEDVQHRYRLPLAKSTILTHVSDTHWEVIFLCNPILSPSESFLTFVLYRENPSRVTSDKTMQREGPRRREQGDDAQFQTLVLVFPGHSHTLAWFGYSQTLGVISVKRLIALSLQVLRHPLPLEREQWQLQE